MGVAMSTDAVKTCGWRTGVNTCRMLRGTDKHCLWHRYWIRLVDAGVPGRPQRDEFVEWWEQFQPYGRYGSNPGFWWADCDVLWAALTGVGEVPVTTDVISRELLARRAEVRYCLAGMEWNDPWLRLSGLPLPRWEQEEWIGKAYAWEEIRMKELIREMCSGLA